MQGANDLLSNLANEKLYMLTFTTQNIMVVRQPANVAELAVDVNTVWFCFFFLLSCLLVGGGRKLLDLKDHLVVI